jgi:hypothetical protein
VSLGVTVICDNCGTILGSAPYGAAAKALEDARDAGATTDLPGGRDLCRACAAREEFSRESVVVASDWRGRLVRRECRGRAADRPLAEGPLTRKENLPVITITVETEEEFKAAKDALRDGLLHEMIGGKFRISVERPEGEHGPNR